ncbi:MAG: NUDIX domain-containing protein [Candidatus Kapabacteria bacterium]|nr:NUDIX domain-containing protein [Candidatus Kapabacteria bacterium]MDW7996730.1 NUDIX domain-containing protein [Bacteroidota bacterium]
MAMLKESVALLIRSPLHPGKVLLVQRPIGDPELPGIWGLPAASLRHGESDHEALERLAQTKLGVQLSDVRFCCSGEQQRPSYLLRMRLYEALFHGNEPQLSAHPPTPGITLYQAWRWGVLRDLWDSAAAGSLCSQLALHYYAR